jgi:3-(3-hydroxy-phenyl)propionate hydroxylase
LRRRASISLIEALNDDNFLGQAARGTNHPRRWNCSTASGSTSCWAAGIIAPLFHYWDRHEGKLVAEFDHGHLKGDTPFPYVLQCERIKIVEEAMKLAKAHPDIDLRLSTDFTAFEQNADGVTATIVNPAGETEKLRGRHRGRRGRAQHHPQGARHRFEGFTYSTAR